MTHVPRLRPARSPPGGVCWGRLIPVTGGAPVARSPPGAHVPAALQHVPHRNFAPTQEILAWSRLSIVSRARPVPCAGCSCGRPVPQPPPGSHAGGRAAPRRPAPVLRHAGLGLVLASVLTGPFPQGLFSPVQYRTAVLAATEVGFAVTPVLLRRAGLGIVAGTLLLGPFPEGLFFPAEFRPAIAGVAFGFVLWSMGVWRGGGRLRPVATGVELAAAALLALYLVTTTVAVFPQGHLDVTLQHAAALMALWMIREEVVLNPGRLATLGWVLVAGGLAVAAVALSPYADGQGADKETLVAMALIGADGRLGASFQYPNTAAIYFEAVALLAAGLAVYARRSVPAYAVAAAAVYVLSVSFVLAASRGAVLVLAFVVLLLPAGLPAGRRLVALLLFGGPFVAAAATARGFMESGALGEWSLALKSLSVGMGGSAAGGVALAAFVNAPRRLRGWFVGTVAVGVLVLVIGVLASGAGLTAARPGDLARRYLPQHAVRLLDMNWHTRNALLRLYYDRDALSMLRDRPWIGGGGRAWERLYHQYQTFWYAASETHNSLLQTATETGVPGLVAILAFWTALTYTSWKSTRTKGPIGSGVPVWPFTAAALAIGLHSAVDFDLSYFSLQLLTWTLAGAVAGAAAGATLIRPQTWSAGGHGPATREQVTEHIRLGAGTPAVNKAAAYKGAGRYIVTVSRRGLHPVLAVAAGAVVLAVAMPQAVSAVATHWAWKRLDNGDSPGAISLFRLAAQLAPFDPQPHVGLARANPGKREQIDHLTAAQAKDPYWFLWPEEEATAHLARQDWRAAARSAERALRLAPARVQAYQIALGAVAEAAIETVLAGDRFGGQRLARRTVEIAEELVRRRQATEPVKHLWPEAQPALTPVFHLRYGQALALLGDPREAISHLEEAAKSAAHRIQAEIWLYLALEAAGARDEAEQLRDRPWVRALDINPVRGILRPVEAGRQADARYFFLAS